MWTILKELIFNKRTQVQVECDCGVVELRRKDRVMSGRTKECKSCSAKRTAKNYPMPSYFTGIGNLSGTMWSSIRAGARKREIKFNIPIEYAWKLYKKQNGKCALSGVPIALIKATKNHAVDWEQTTASLDRINSKLGYVEGNLQWVHKEVNYIKRDLTDGEFITWCNLISNYRGGSCGS